MTPLRIVIDTREQRPWAFPAEVEIVRAALPAGDYTIFGAEGRIAIERKELGDFVACCTHQRERFEREMDRLREYDFAAVIVEATMGQIWSAAYRSRTLPQSVIGSAAAWHVDFSIPIIFGETREHSADFALRLLRRLHAKATQVAA